MLPALNPADLQPQDRADPFCSHFGPCGGCQLQHLTYAAQFGHKAAQLRALLEAASLALPELQLHPSLPLAYRNRIRLTLAVVDGKLRAGYIGSLVSHGTGNSTAHHEHTEQYGFPETRLEVEEGLKLVSIPYGISFLPIRECPIAAPILWRAAEALLALLNQSPGAWLRNSPHLMDQLELFTTADESRLQLTLYLRTAAKSLPAELTTAFTALCEVLRTRVPELSGAGILLLPLLSRQRSRRVEQPRPGPTWGSPGLNYTVAPLEPRTLNLEPQTYWVPRGAFFQVNRFLLPELRALVTANRTGQLAYDLYAGVGLFSRALAVQFTQVTAVEAAEPAFIALASTKLANLRDIQATTLDFLRTAVLERDRPGLIVLDPPRSGAGAEVCALLARIAAPTLIYVSCSPETLPADLKTLTASGYTLDDLHLFDLFPQTTHIETVAILTRKK
jgi:23S rRNA (uracil1939-C5)-methyltransferase